MAERAFGNQTGNSEGTTYTVTGLLNGDTSSSAMETGTGDKTVQVNGTFGVGGTCIIEGSLDGVNYYQLKDPTGTLISFTAAGLRAVLENTPHTRFRVTAGDGTTSLTGIVALRGN